MRDLQARSGKPLSIVSVLGDPARQHDLDAILAIVPGGRPLPGTGGQFGEPGTATAGYASLRPLPIWCVAPVLKSSRDPGELVRGAVHEGLQLAEIQGFTSVGIVLGDKQSAVVPWPEMVALVVEAATGYRCAGTRLGELCLLVSDSEVLAHVAACLNALPATGT